MSKKHFIALAEALRNTRPSEPEDPMSRDDGYLCAKAQWNRDVRVVADVCNYNPQFDYQRFLDRCHQ
jgi:hypothetical protein